MLQCMNFNASQEVVIGHLGCYSIVRHILHLSLEQMIRYAENASFRREPLKPLEQSSFELLGDTCRKIYKLGNLFCIFLMAPTTLPRCLYWLRSTTISLHVMVLRAVRNIEHVEELSLLRIVLRILSSE